jgi:hypothetical protein
MFFLLGWRYPWLTLVLGIAILIAGVVIGQAVFAALGGLGVLIGGYRCIRQYRRRGMIGGGRGMIGGSGNRGPLL